ncbi:CesT family type III secretion system chaperone [Endozoicomonas sp. SCSIO W0465]|uniref:CesT family type III secretion system chaperone n=1 Tax=Endozoicomonas sp. SCSIO W0465 TaxID=2918516 RepID=UPI0020754370|nr:CesT family type III secretion system chaperone [Endozoicomonas sp. SCSIO W0465]USE35053.1 type III secretion system chaperone [Endozoicomonas sp. SCSIO W0465]
MSDSHEHFELLIQHLNDLSGQKFPMIDSACTLFNEKNEIAAVVELPESSDLLLFHRLVARLPSDPETRNGRALQLLTLNGVPDKLQGAWFSIDPEGYGIYLMTGHPIDNLSTNGFESLLMNFIHLADTLASELADEEQELAKVSPNHPGVPI